MVDMSVPQPGRHVAAFDPQSRSIAVSRELGKPDYFEVFTGEVGVVLRVTPHVTGSGRYVLVKFTDSHIGYVHESNLRNI
jgi:hypothetical protein